MAEWTHFWSEIIFTESNNQTNPQISKFSVYFKLITFLAKYYIQRNCVHILDITCIYIGH